MKHVLIEAEHLTRDAVDDPLPDTTGGRFSESESDIAQVLEVRTTLDNQDVTLIIDSVRRGRIVVVVDPSRNAFRYPIDVIMAA